ncbi:hypothetical protein EV360DRAFT_80064 [Lentinula raphanica]|nr:hypothetical protein EV360DRAFT_80064 [Lentinula raphanica]
MPSLLLEHARHFRRWYALLNQLPQQPGEDMKPDFWPDSRDGSWGLEDVDYGCYVAIFTYFIMIYSHLDLPASRTQKSNLTHIGFALQDICFLQPPAKFSRSASTPSLVSRARILEREDEVVLLHRHIAYLNANINLFHMRVLIRRLWAKPLKEIEEGPQNARLDNAAMPAFLHLA